MVIKHKIRDSEEEKMQKKSRHKAIDSEQDSHSTKSKILGVKWTDDENATLLRLRDDEKKSWDEIIDSDLLRARSKRSIQCKYGVLKDKERPSIPIDDDFRDLLWDFWKSNKGVILNSLKEDIKSTYEEDVVVFPKAKLESLLVQVLSDRIKKPK